MPTPLTRPAVERLKEHTEIVVTEEAEAALQAEENLEAELAAYHGTDYPDMPEHLSGYQRMGAQFLARMGRGILADGLGLGKTAQSIAACDLLGCQRILVIAPKSLLLQWQHEINKFSTGQVQIFGRNLQLVNARWYITNYETIAPCLEYLKRHKFDCLICDEAVRLKHHKIQRTRAVFKLSRTIPHCFLLTGTPIRNKPHELFSLLHIVDHKRYSSFWSFIAAFVETWDNGFGTEFGGIRKDRLDEFKAELLPRLLRRTKELLGLPELTQSTVDVELDNRADQAYHQMEAHFAAITNNGRVLVAPNVLAQLMRLRQITLDPNLCKLPGNSSKTEWILDWLSDHAAEHKTLIFTPFSTYAHRLQAKLKDYGAVCVTGDEDTATRDDAVRRLNEDPNCRVLIGTDSAAGEGLNLQAADVVIFPGKSWTPDLVEQCIGRAHRRGQHKPVHVYSLVAPNTIDEDIERVLELKAELATEALAIENIAKRILERRKHDGGQPD